MAVELDKKTGKYMFAGKIYKDEKYSKAYVSRIYFFLNKLYKFGVTSEYIQSNSMTYVKRDLRLNERKEEMTIWQQYDFDLFIEEVDEQMMKCFYSVLFYMGLRRGETMALQWKDIDFRKQTIDINKTYRYKEKDPNKWLTPPKTNNSYRTITMPNTLSKMLREWFLECSKWDDFTKDKFVFGYYKPISPQTVQRRFDDAYNKAKEKDDGLPKIRIHDFRHPYVKHTTKIFSLRLMDFQAQAYPDARRKTRGACQLLRVGQSRSPVRPLCNRKRFSCLPPQSKMSWILYAISMRLSGYTSTRSISSSASSVVSVSASKIALDASLRLSCRACSSCFFFACANTAA